MKIEEYKQKYGSSFDDLVEEMNLLHPEEMEEARKWAMGLVERIKAGEKVFEVKPVVFTKDGREITLEELSQEMN